MVSKIIAEWHGGKCKTNYKKVNITTEGILKAYKVVHFTTAFKRTIGNSEIETAKSSSPYIRVKLLSDHLLTLL